MLICYSLNIILQKKRDLVAKQNLPITRNDCRRCRLPWQPPTNAYRCKLQVMRCAKELQGNEMFKIFQIGLCQCKKNVETNRQVKRVVSNYKAYNCIQES